MEIWISIFASSYTNIYTCGLTITLKIRKGQSSIVVEDKHNSFYNKFHNYRVDKLLLIFISFLPFLLLLLLNIYVELVC